jgi:hypothetical protein
LDLKKAKEATENAKTKAESAAKDMSQFYASLLSVDAKNVWNKIVQEQMQSDPCTYLQGVSKKGPRGPLQKSFDDWVMFHLLTVFPNNTEQKRYYLRNVLKKPQRISVHQFVQHVEQPKSYIAQLPCWFYSPSVKPNTTPANVPCTKADLVSHVLWMCPALTWQDQFNLHEKGMTPVNMHLLLMSLKAIERVCMQEKSSAQSGKKASNKGKKGNKRPGTDATIRVPKKACTKKHCDHCKKHGGVHTMHNTRDCCKYEKDKMEKAEFCAAKKGGKKSNPAKQSFAQLSEKLDKLEKAIKKQSAKSKKHHKNDSNSNSEYGIGVGSIEKVEIKLGETVKKTNFTPHSPIKAAPTIIAINQDEVCPMSFSNASDVMLMSSSQNEEVHDSYSTPNTKDPPEGKTPAVIAVMRGKPKDGCHCHRSNKHYKQKLVRVLLDRGSDGDLVFVNKDKPMLLPYSKRLVPQLWNT